MFSREGFTVDVVAGAARKTVLNPFAAVPLALGLSWEPFFAKVLEHLSASRAETLRKGAYIFAAASVALALNRFLTKQSNNNWTSASKWNWDDEIAVVTGGSSGIGASIAKQLLARNGRTRIVIVDYAPLRWTPPAGSRVSYFECDLSDADAIKVTCDAIKAQVGDPTVLYNNAGLARGQTVMDGTPNDVQLTIKTNLIAPFLLAKEFLPAMVRRDHGHIVNTGSMSSIVAAGYIVDYSASKAGLTALHEGLQLELKHIHKAKRVRLTLGIFGFIRTPLFTGKTNESNFTTPLLNVETVAERLVNAVYSGYGSTIYLPGIMNVVTSLRGGPAWLFRVIRDRSTRIDLDIQRQTEQYLKTDGKRIGPGLQPLK